MNAIAIIESELVNGWLTFHQCYEHTECIVNINLSGQPDTVHAIHIHEFGDTSQGCESLGPHWNPTKTTHGSILVPERPRHSGDLCSNIVFDQEGKFIFTYKDPLINVEEIYGRSVVIHDKPDDLGLGKDKESLKTGNAGKRIACAVIGRKNEK